MKDKFTTSAGILLGLSALLLSGCVGVNYDKFVGSPVSILLNTLGVPAQVEVLNKNSQVFLYEKPFEVLGKGIAQGDIYVPDPNEEDLLFSDFEPDNATRIKRCFIAYIVSNKPNEGEGAAVSVDVGEASKSKGWFVKNYIDPDYFCRVQFARIQDDETIEVPERPKFVIDKFITEELTDNSES